MSPELLPQIGAPAAIGLCGLSLAGGAMLARLSSPLACTWPATGHALLLRLKTVRLHHRVGPARIAAGVLLLGALITGAGVAAYAAAPAALPDTLPSRVAGVIGSGDQIKLRLTGSDGARTVAVGEEVSDGWVLSGLTASAATLTKNGQSRQVGLNPTGTLASASDSAPSTVTMEGAALPTLADVLKAVVYPNRATASAAELQAFGSNVNSAMMAAPPGTTFPGLDANQTQRFFGLGQKVEDLKTAMRQGQAPPLPFFTEDLTWPGHDLIVAALGPDAAEYERLLGQVDDAGSVGFQRTQLAAAPIEGPSSYYVPAGGSAALARLQAGVDARGTWVASLPDADGGQTITRVSDFNGAQQSRNLAQAQAALRDASAIAAGADPAQFGMTQAGAASLLATLPASVRAHPGTMPAPPVRPISPTPPPANSQQGD